MLEMNRKEDDDDDEKDDDDDDSVRQSLLIAFFLVFMSHRTRPSRPFSLGYAAATVDASRAFLPS
jgi:hypothetical protein